MSILTIMNNKLSVDINSLGANLWSIKDQEGTEYLWQGDVNTWPDKSMNFFPDILQHPFLTAKNSMVRYKHTMSQP